MTYAEFLSEKLKKAGVTEGYTITVTASGKEYTGVLMPHHEFSGEDIIILKQKSGYNVGIRLDKDSKITVVSEPHTLQKKENTVEDVQGLKTIQVLGTGGTIASYVDYRTGAVHPAISTSELIGAVPEIREVANIRAKVLFSIFSENMGLEQWETLGKSVAEEIEQGADGVIIPHGTDTMGYSAAALSFMLGNLGVPVVFVGAQRSQDRPSSDASSNLLAAARFIVSGKAAGVFVCMHYGEGDDTFAIHTGTRVRKMHTSRRDAFKSINTQPVALIDRDGKITIQKECKPVSKSKIDLKNGMCDSVVLLQYFPGMDPKLFRDVIMKSKGVVISGTGLGHVSEKFVPLIKEASDAGTIVCITSQCLNGSTNLNVYNTGRDIVRAGAVPLGDMLPETAYAKLSWVLANIKNRDAAIVAMQSCIADEISERRVE